jgi:3-deoxy-D-arabino-heptulosonate 7-phosphate (DAHP) synthase
MEIVADFLVKNEIRFIRGSAYKPHASTLLFSGASINIILHIVA